MALPVTVNGTDRLRLSIRYHTWEPDSWGPFLDDVTSGDLVVDVGANVGLYSLAAAKRGGSVVAFEPDPANARILAWHARANRVRGRVRLVQAAAGSELAALPFASRQSLVSGGADLYLGGTTQFTLMPVIPLDAVFYKTRVNLLKIDVEGMEADVLRGAEGLLNDPHRRPRKLLVEVHEPVLAMRGESWDQLRALLPYDWRRLGGQGAQRWLGTA